MQRIYEYLGPEHFALMLAGHFRTVLEANGFTLEVEAGSAVGPHVHQYVSRQDGRRVISLLTDHTGGGPAEMEVTLETEALDDVVTKVVAEGVVGLLAEASKGLLESVDDAAARAQIIDRLTEVLAGLK